MGAAESEATTKGIQLGKSCTITVFKRFKEGTKHLTTAEDVRLHDYQAQDGAVNLVCFDNLAELEEHLRRQGVFGLRMLDSGDVLTLFYGDTQEKVMSLLYVSTEDLKRVVANTIGDIQVIDGSGTNSFIILTNPLMSKMERLVRGLEDEK